MPPSTKFSERLTTLLSTLVAAGLLAAGVTAQQSRTSRPVSLERLESDLRFQIRSAFRMTPLESERRLERVNEVLGEFRRKQRGETEQKVLAAWLLEATVRSMPGTVKPLPTAPVYQKPTKPRPVVKAAPRTRQPTRPRQKPVFQERSLVEIAPPLQIEAPAKEQPRVAKKPRREPQVRLATSKPAVEASKPEKSKVVAMVPRDPSPVTKPLPTSPTAQLVSNSDTTVARAQTPVPIVINRTELVARIAGYHTGLDELEAASISASTPEEKLIVQQIDLLESLVTDYQFVRLYYETLDPQEQSRVVAPRKLNVAVVEVREQLAELQEASENDFLGEYDRSLGQRLTALRQRLEEIAAEVAW